MTDIDHLTFPFAPLATNDTAAFDDGVVRTLLLVAEQDYFDAG